MPILREKQRKKGTGKSQPVPVRVTVWVYSVLVLELGKEKALPQASSSQRMKWRQYQMSVVIIPIIWGSFGSNPSKKASQAYSSFRSKQEQLLSRYHILRSKQHQLLSQLVTSFQQGEVVPTSSHTSTLVWPLTDSRPHQPSLHPVKEDGLARASPSTEKKKIQFLRQEFLWIPFFGVFSLYQSWCSDWFTFIEDLFLS